jgi:ribosomal-protein-alanine N-acetyltransferase
MRKSNVGNRASFRVTAFRPGDLTFLDALERRAGSRQISREALAREVSGPRTRVLIARRGAKRIGAVIFWDLPGERQVVELVVDTNERRKGVARRLLNEVLQNASHTTLEVRASHAAALGLYRSLGFRQVGIRRSYYEGQEDAVLMERKSLSQ